ncbi:hypothetical protein [Nitratireductor sp. GCM10026969]
MHDIALKIALIGAAGMAAQWLAWRPFGRRASRDRPEAVFGTGRP